MNVKAIWGLVRAAAGHWINDRAPRLAAALSFYSLFAMAPLLVILVSISGAVLGREEIKDEVVRQVEQTVGPDAGDIAITLIDNAGRAGRLATLLGIAGILVGATGLFVALKDSLNTIWDVEPGPGHTIRNLVRSRILAFIVVLCIAALLLVLLVSGMVIAAAVAWAEDRLPVPPWLLQTANFTITFLLVTVLFAAVYKVLPDARIAWTDVWAGAGITAALFTIGNMLMGFYFAYASPASVYGAAGSLVIVLLWTYYSALIFLFGAEVTQEYARCVGKHIEPASYAVRRGSPAPKPGPDQCAKPPASPG